MNVTTETNRLENFPISFFSVVMGLTGFTITLQKAQKLFGINQIYSKVSLYISVFIFILLFVFYLLKILFYLDKFKEEFSNPIRLNFFPTFSISLLLLSVAFLEENIKISKVLWIIGMVSHLLLTIIVISQWIQQTHFNLQHYNPSWFIPVVGNIIVPIAGVEHAQQEISWFFFSIGIVFWISLFTIFLYRIIFHHPLSQKLVPTLFILIAPPAVGFISYVKLTGRVDEFAKIVYYVALFLVILLLAQVRLFLNVKFYLSWWAYSFPMAAISIATFLIYTKLKFEAYKYLFGVLFTLLIFIIIVLSVATLINIFKKNICIEEE
ncbi:SLAC1 anion channel family protein [Caldicellulosiruptor acetigenus]|uniref:C4-dicarboxylate transporter/malic acid transport protein n=1 Tax=Caldicellulosiruptor acetigenus 6A TaxID=632516 RepID=G2PVU2_9FIRM|nr:SLAC1 anion channel family protein [Caldicellulosiruptor acetigenus]AEM72836.1 C4-dicarboxylate transporter/malic acid transport protein [Caldicellulosiruptor acetigenus 6A]